MPAHKTNPFLKWALMPVIALMLIIFVLSLSRCGEKPVSTPLDKNIKNTASKDSAKESLDTLTAELGETKQAVSSVVKTNDELKIQNKALLAELQGKKDSGNLALEQKLEQKVEDLKTQLSRLNTQPKSNTPNNIYASDNVQPINAVPELATLLNPISSAKNNTPVSNTKEPSMETKKILPVPFYTIPANATSVEDRLMTALVGRIPVKGVVTDPYPFKIVMSDDTLAANGLRVPNLKQMIVSGYTEGDLNLISVRGWVTSLTFVFQDGTISSTSSNANNIGKYTKDDALGYLTDQYGNPFIRGKIITNAPTYLGMNVALGAAQGAAAAYAQSQTTTTTNLTGGSNASVTGSPGAYVAGQAAGNAAANVQQWWSDRQAQSFDAVYVPTVDEKTQAPIFIAVNFAKEIRIDYDPLGRKLVHARERNTNVVPILD